VRLAVLAFLLALGACGGRVDQGGDAGSAGVVVTHAEGGAGSGSGSSGGGSSGGGVVPLCPTDPPTPGTSCAAPGQQGCVYVNVGSSCVSFVCDDNGVWQSTTEGC
jgi:hypothetical protein